MTRPPDTAATRQQQSGLPLHLRPRLILLVGVGGALGTLARYLIGLAVPTLWQVPWATFLVNLLGAFLLGALLEGLARRGHDSGIRRMLRLLVGTGFMGGFTTYSSLAVQSQLLLAGGMVWVGIGYGLVTLAVGLFASLLGIWAAAVHHRSRAGSATRTGTDAGADS